MRAFLALGVVVVLAAPVDADVHLTVCTPDQGAVLSPDPNAGCYTVMAGTRLPIVINSDTGDVPWSGALGISAGYWEYGRLSGRGRDDDPNLSTLSYPDSALEAAGLFPSVRFVCVDSAHSSAFSFLADRRSLPGDWFVLDYRAEKAGHCEVNLFEYDVSYETPTQTLCFEHVPSRDFNDDKIVNFVDFALLAAQYRSAADPGTPFDIDDNALVDAWDIDLLNDYWLTATDANEPLVEEPPPPCFPDGG
jgi:hypothetical protein